MNALDLHPEELFDKVAQGVASADEAARAHAHLAACAVCRFERQARADFAGPLSQSANVDDLVARALSGALQPDVVAAAPSWQPRRRLWSAFAVAAATLVGVSSFAAVAQLTGFLPALVTAMVSPRRAMPLAPAPLRESPVTPQEVVPPVPNAPAESALLLPVAVPQSRVKRPAPSSVVAAARAELDSSESASPESPAMRRPTSLELFTTARRARLAGDVDGAVGALRALVAQFPTAAETPLAEAELGRLSLDRGDAATALQAFDSYLGGNQQQLREDVMGARAMALAQLGRREEERAAWEALLREYPLGVFSSRAAGRLESLSH